MCVNCFSNSESNSCLLWVARSSYSVISSHVYITEVNIFVIVIHVQGVYYNIDFKPYEHCYWAEEHCVLNVVVDKIKVENEIKLMKIVLSPIENSSLSGLLSSSSSSSIQ